MKTVYIVYTVVSGHSYVICYINNEFTVKTIEGTPDNLIAQWPTEADAQRIADSNSKNGIQYRVKPIEVKS